jgi:hypothetical protein
MKFVWNGVFLVMNWHGLVLNCSWACVGFVRLDYYDRHETII